MKTSIPSLTMVLVLLASVGCVQRRLVIRSEPEGAFVTVDDQPVGHTPLSVPFDYYGTRDIHMEKDGFKTVDIKEKISAPWYAYPPISLISDNFVFREIRDQRIVDIQLEPESPVNEDVLLQRASQLRGDFNNGMVTMPIDPSPSVDQPQVAPGTVTLPLGPTRDPD